MEVQITKEYKDRLYGKKLIPLPRPKFVVFYNGLEDQPDRVERHAWNAGQLCLTSTRDTTAGSWISAGN